MIFGISLTLHLKQLTSLREKCPYLELFWSRFSRIWTEHGEILRIALYSVRMRENGDQKNSEYRHFTNFVLVSCFHFHYCFWIPKEKVKGYLKFWRKKGHSSCFFWNIMEFSRAVILKNTSRQQEKEVKAYDEIRVRS